MKFIQLQENWKRVTCLCLSKDRHYLAIGGKLREDKSAYIFIYKYVNGLLKYDRKAIQCGEVSTGTSKEFISITFSSDLKFICGLSKPDFQANIWEWHEKIKVIASCMMDPNITRITFNPKDKHVVCTSGHQHFRLWGVQDNTLKGYQVQDLDEHLSYKDHAWLEDDNIVTCDERGIIYIIDKSANKVIQISCAFEPTIESQGLFSCSCLLSVSRGFLVGSKQGALSLWIRSESSFQQGKTVYEFNKKWALDRKGELITGIGINGAEDMIAVAYANNNIGLSLYEINDSHPIAMGKNMEIGSKVEIICDGFHSGKISAMDIAIQRPLIVTVCKSDFSIKVWNYLTLKCELSKKLNITNKENKDDVKPIKCIAFHPSGYYIACGFKDRVDFFYILHNQLKFYRFLNIKQSNRIKFSHGGHLILITTKQKEVFLYNSYTLIALLKNLKVSNPPKSIAFSNNDMYFCISYGDGVVATYNSTTYGKETSEELLIKERNVKPHYAGLVMNDYVNDVKSGATKEVIDAKINIMVTVGTLDANTGVIESFKKGKLEYEYTFNEYKFTAIEKIESLTTNPKVFNYIVGSNKGDILTFVAPFTKDVAEYKGVVDILHAHKGKVQAICSSSDGRYVFTAGKDGSVFVYSVLTINEEGQCIADLVLSQPEKDRKKYFDERALIIDEQLADVLMIEKSDLEAFRIKQNELIASIDKIEADLTSNKQQQQSSLEDQIVKAENKRVEELKSSERRIKQLQETQQRTTQDQSQRLKDMEITHQAAMDELQQLYEKKLAIESKKYENTETTNMDIANKFQQQINELKQKYEKSVEDLMAEFKKDFHQLHEFNNTEKGISNELERKYEEKLNQLEDEHETEVKDLVKNHDTKRQVLLETKEMLENKKKQVLDEKTKLEEQTVNKYSEIESLTNSIKKLNEDDDRLRIVISSKEEEKKQAKEELDKKKNKLFEYKQKIKEVQKYLNVLDALSKENEEKIKPKEKQINTMKDQLVNVESQFEEEIKAMSEMEKQKNKQAAKIAQLIEDETKLSLQIKEKEAKLEEVLRSIHNTIATKKPKEYISDMQELYRKYVLGGDNDLHEKLQKDPGTVNELERQIKYMESSLKVTANKSDQKNTLGKNNLTNKTTENKELINELDKLRKKNEELKSKAEQYAQEAKKIARRKAEENQPKKREDSQELKPSTPATKKKGKVMKGATAHKSSQHESIHFRMPDMLVYC